MSRAWKLVQIGLHAVTFPFLLLFFWVVITTNGTQYSDPLGPIFWLVFFELFIDFGFLALIFFFLIGLIGAAIGNKAARAGRSWTAFFWLSALISPIIMGIIAVTLKPVGQSVASESLLPPKLESSLESKLLQLHSLKEQGILSDDEFEEAKKRTLGL
jgi:hypothetical protein